VALALDSRRIGEIVVITCAGRMVEGDESARLHERVVALLPTDPYIVLDLAAVEFVDSGGLGLLVRMLHQAEAAGGDLKLCALPARIKEILRVTKLHTVFDCHQSQADAVEAFYRDTRTPGAAERLATDILCVAPSLDVIAYLREVLRQAGHGVMTSDNLPDALMLLRATRPKLAVVSADLLAGSSAPAAETFKEIAGQMPIVQLPRDFSHRDAGAAASRLLEQVRAGLAAQ
jgi:anti-anti-sigma factor